MKEVVEVHRKRLTVAHSGRRSGPITCEFTVVLGKLNVIVTVDYTSSGLVAADANRAIDGIQM